MQDQRVTNYNVGIMYLEGNGVEQNHAEGIKLLTLSAEAGYDKAQYKSSLFRWRTVGNALRAPTALS